VLLTFALFVAVSPCLSEKSAGEETKAMDCVSSLLDALPLPPGLVLLEEAAHAPLLHVWFDGQPVVALHEGDWHVRYVVEESHTFVLFEYTVPL